MVLLIGVLAFGLREPGFGKGQALAPRTQSVGEALKEALGHSSFVFLTLGYFVCGFQVMFIGVHMPSYLKDFGLAPQVASYSLALIGLFNIFGTYIAGNLGQQPAQAVSCCRAFTGCGRVVTVLFLLAPLSPWSVYVYAAVMGFLWLSTVPLTNAIVGADFWRAAPVHARRLYLLQPPDRQLYGHLVGRLPVRQRMATTTCFGT